MKASALALAAAFAAPVASTLSGTYKGSVPFILDMTITFPGDGTMDFDQNVKVASTEVKCPTEKIAETDSQVTFPETATDGDCMGDALRGQSKDPSKFLINVNSDGSLTFKSDGWPDLKLTKASALAVADTCSLFEIADDSCGQSDLDCNYVKYAKAAEQGLADGTCADQGYTEKTGTQTKSYPVIGDIVISTYSKPALSVADTCSLYEIADGSCGQSDLDCNYVKYAKAAEQGLADGTCAAQGYTEKTGTQTKSYPVIGDIVISTYSKPALSVADTCSLFEIADGSCGQSDLDCSYVKYAKAAEQALADGTCADQGYTVKTGTQTKSYPIIGDIIISTYSKPDVTVVV